MSTWILVSLVLIAVGAAWARARSLRRRGLLANPGTRAHTADPIVVERVLVQTHKGAVSGFRSATAGPLHFRGIPFAAPIGGSDAFRPPAPVAPWAPAVLDAHRFGPAVPQDRSQCTLAITGTATEAMANYGPTGDGGLNLNVVTPAVDGRLPVLVWIHGGANKSGSNAESGLLMPGSAFARRGVVSVALNYRVGLEGFLHLPAQQSTNRAVRDLIAGLTWVRDEIAAFGGDPGNVTVYGESAGAANIATLLASPRATGLLHKAILSSGAANTLSATEAAVVCGDAFAALRAKRPDVAFRADGEPELETLSAAASRAAASAMKDSMLDEAGVALSPAHFVSVVGDDVLPRPVLEALRAGQARGIPLLCGYNNDEFAGFFRCLLAGMGLPPTLQAPLISLVLRRMPGALGPEVMLRRLAGISRSDPGGDDDALATAVSALRAALAELPAQAVAPRSAWRRWFAVDEGDALPSLLQLLATAPQDALADAQARHAAVFSYTLRLDAQQSPRGGNMHGLDLALAFRPDDEFTAAERAFTAQAFFARNEYGAELDAVVEGWRDAIVRFMRTGTPAYLEGAAGARAEWLPHGDGRMVLSASPCWSSLPHGKSRERQALDDVLAVHFNSPAA